MPSVQVPHRGHERNPLTLIAPSFDDLLKLRDPSDAKRSLETVLCAGKLTALNRPGVIAECLLDHQRARQESSSRIGAAAR